MKNNEVDLHLLSGFSCGSDSPETIVEKLAAANVKIAALTDLDTVAGVERFIRHSLKKNVMAIPAVEVSTAFDLKYSAHILGLNVNYQIPGLEKLFESNNVERTLHNMQVICKLNEKGILKKTFEELVSIYDYRGYCVTPYHAIDYLVSYVGHNFEQTEKIVMEIDRSYAHNLSMILPTEQGINAVAKLGGIPILAHPGELEKQFHGSTWQRHAELVSVLRHFKRMGLLGIEAFHAQHTSTEEIEYVTIAKELGLFVTAGSGYCGRHKKENLNVGRSGLELIDILQILHQFWNVRASQRTMINSSFAW